MARKDRNVFTIMIVPHAETKVFTFRLSTIAFQFICYALVCLFLGMMIMARSYQTMASNMWELEELRLVNREQRDQIEQLVSEARAVQERMVILDELDKQVREMMELESYERESTSLASAFPFQASAGSSEATIASGTGLGGPSLPQTGGVTVVSRRAVREALEALTAYNKIDQAVTQRSESLAQLRKVITDDATYRSAKPSIWPAHGYVSSGYGYRRTIFGGDQHAGYDIAARVGTPIVATADGTVVFAGWSGAYGNVVEVEHAYGWTTVYAHMSKMAVSLGDRVRRGEVVGFIGSTGRSTGPHVHYEVRINGRTDNPRYYLWGN